MAKFTEEEEHLIRNRFGNWSDAEVAKLLEQITYLASTREPVRPAEDTPVVIKE